MKREIFSNRVIWEREINYRKHLHADKVKNTKSTAKSHVGKALMNMTSPATFSHLYNNAKKKRMDEDKAADIERENKRLMDKMMAVFTATSDGAVEYIPGLRLNANQQPVLDHYLSKNTTTRGTAKPLLTLNLEARRREFKRIVSENNLMLQRLESSHSQYSREKWADQYAELQHRQKYMAKDGTIGYLPPVATRPSTTAAAGSRVRLPKMTSERTSASAPTTTMHRSQTASSPSRDFPEPSPEAAAEAGVPSPGRILFVTVRSVDGVEPVHLVVREVPYDDAADTAIPAASALVVACTRDEAILCSPIEIPFTKLAYFVQDSAAADDLRPVLGRLTTVHDGAGFLRPSIVLSGVEQRQLGRVMCDRIAVVVEDDGNVHLQLRDTGVIATDGSTGGPADVLHHRYHAGVRLHSTTGAKAPYCLITVRDTDVVVDVIPSGPSITLEIPAHHVDTLAEDPTAITSVLQWQDVHGWPGPAFV